jgi:hypothetical protein
MLQIIFKKTSIREMRFTPNIDGLQTIFVQNLKKYILPVGLSKKKLKILLNKFKCDLKDRDHNREENLRNICD